MRFTTLDGLRGLAAILVLFFHLGPHAPMAAPGGYLAVDLFFALSGFVISLAYDGRFRAGLSLWEFTRYRLIRVYPMAFLSALFGAALSRDYFASLILIPDLSGGPTGMLFPMNVPLWSLLLEVVINVLYAFCAVRLRTAALCFVILLSGGILAVGMTRYPLAQIGIFWLTIGYGLARTVFSFSLGVTMQRIHTRYPVRRRVTRLAWLLPCLLVLLLTQPFSGSWLWNAVCLSVALPAILWLGTIWETPNTHLWHELGALSYPLYCIHGVALLACQAAGGRAEYLWAPLIGVAWWLNRRIDIPLRRKLTQLFTVDREKGGLSSLALKKA